jgi:type II secretory pathway pseudopilin PulG
MVNLIITLISIALIAIVAVAALYNGGDAFRQGSANASAAQLVNAGQQISAANILYANDNGGTYATAVADLTANGEYLSSIPRVPEGFEVSNDLTNGGNDSNLIQVTSSDPAVEVCESVNKQGGYDETTVTTANTNGDFVLADSAAITQTFGCYGDDTAGYTFEFK